MDGHKDAVVAAQAVYTPLTLRVYDHFVLGFSNHFAWRCPASRLLQNYQENISANHLDVGVGTGYFIDRVSFPVAGPRIGLLDLNEDCLKVTSRRLGRYHPEFYQANVLEPFQIEAAPFESVGLNYLFHCLPGRWTEKLAAIDHLKPYLNPGARLFGSTILAEGGHCNMLARKLMATYNLKGFFNNTNDDLDGLRDGLESRLDDVVVEQIGCVALFRALVPL